jgi:predicted alpha/beta superfamily hydrolase
MSRLPVIAAMPDNSGSRSDRSSLLFQEFRVTSRLCRQFSAIALSLAMFHVVDAVAATPAPSDPPFQIENSYVHALVDPVSKRTYDLYIKLPPGYNLPANANKRYPVVYLNDGPYTFQVASGVTRVPFSHAFFKEFILVGIGYAHDEDPMVSRRRDMTPTVDASKESVTGGARAYLDFIKQQAIPYVDRTWRTDPTERTLSGQSYGALFGLWVALTEPDAFRHYILSSTSIWYDKHVLYRTEAAYASSHHDLKADLYFAVGGMERPGICSDEPPCEDMVGDQLQMVKLLQAHHYPNLRIKARVVEGAYHYTAYPVALTWALQDLFQARR